MFARWQLMAALAVALAGCDNPPDEGRPPGPTESDDSQQPASIKSYAAADLPEVADPLPTYLDDGRVELSPPKGWRVLARDPKFLARFVTSRDPNELPRIVVHGIPAPEGVENVSEENAAEFAEKMQERAVREGKAKNRRMLEPCRPVILGDIVWSRHVRYIYARGPGAVQALETARRGRLYIIELTVQAKEDSDAAFAEAILAHRDAAYAVGANWKFVGEAQAPVPAEAAADELAKPAASDEAKK